MEGLEGFNIIRVYRKVTIRYNVNQESGETAALTQRPEGKENKCRAFNGILLLAVYALGISSIVIGSLHVNDCPADKRVPVSLIVFGGLIIVARLMNCVYDCRSVCEEYIRENQTTPDNLIGVNVLFVLADAAAVITMSYFTFSISPTTNPDDHLLNNYCEHLLYNYTWYLSLVGLIIFGLPVLCICCIATAKNNE